MRLAEKIREAVAAYLKTNAKQWYSSWNTEALFGCLIDRAAQNLGGRCLSWFVSLRKLASLKVHLFQEPLQLLSAALRRES